MIKINICDAVKITNKRVKPYAGIKRYLATGDLSLAGVDGFTNVTYENKPSRADLLVDKGSLIIARMKETNKVFLIDESTEDLIVSTGFLTLKPQNDFEGEYLFYYFRSDHFQRAKDSLCSGATQKAINNQSFKKLEVPYQASDKQKRIVEILDTADRMRQKRREQIKLLDDYLKSVFLHMFGDPILNEKRWEQLSLGEISAEIKYGTNVKCFDYSEINKIPVLRIPNIFNGSINLIDLKYANCSQKEFMKLLLKKNDLLFVRTNGNPDYIGRCAVFTIEGDYVNASYLIRVRLKKSAPIQPFFVCYVVSLPSYRSKIIKESRTTAGNYNINTQGLKNLKIMQPPLELQNKFASIVNQVEAMKRKMRESLDEMDTHFNALMHQFFG